tara:strand:+ start:182 stop:415 length:234 start_codon:yes stop_codon:yes gene_type:complete
MSSEDDVPVLRFKNQQLGGQVRDRRAREEDEDGEDERARAFALGMNHRATDDEMGAPRRDRSRAARGSETRDRGRRT